MLGKKRFSSFSDVVSARSRRSVFAARGYKRLLLVIKHTGWKRICISLVSAGIVIGALLYSRAGRSESAAFYPASCLGGWEHPENAQGKPDVTQESVSADQFTGQNSAVLRNAISQMYCGSFTGTIPDSSQPVQATIRFSVALKQDNASAQAATTPLFNPEFPLISPTATLTASTTLSSTDIPLVSDVFLPEATSSSDQTQASSSVDIAPTVLLTATPAATSSQAISPSPVVSSLPSPSSVLQQTPVASSDPVISAWPAVTPAPLPSPTVMPTQTVPPPADTPSPVVSLLHFLFPQAFALDDASFTPDITPTGTEQALPLASSGAQISTTTPTMSQSPAVSLTESASSSVSMPISPPPAAVQENTPVPQPIPEISTTIDEVPSSVSASSVLNASSSSVLSISPNLSPKITTSTGALWEVLYTTDGTTWIHVAYLGQGDWNTVLTTLPSFSWSDLATLQVSIRSLPASGDVPTVYLDALWINVNYIPVSPSSSPGQPIQESHEQIRSFGSSTSTPSVMAIAPPDDLRGRDFARALSLGAVTVLSQSNAHGQRGVVVRADRVAGVSSADINAGWVSWSFIPASIPSDASSSIRQYAYDHYLAFTNDSANMLIDDNSAIPDTPVRIAIFSWACQTVACDTKQDMASVSFLARQAINYHRIASGTEVMLSAYGLP